MTFDEIRKLIDAATPGPWRYAQLLPLLLDVAEAAHDELLADHREWDHREGCPSCDASRRKGKALARLEEWKP